MAGQWLKFDASTPEKPETFAITVALGWSDPDLTVGKLLKVWRWFDEHTVNGNAPSVTLALLDLISGVPGLAKAMCDVCWLRETDTGVALPNFDYHNGKTAKERALAAKRAANFRAGGPDTVDGNDDNNGDGVTDALPREEKRRVNSKPIKTKAKAPAAPSFDPRPDLVAHQVDAQTITDWLALRAKKRAPVTPTVLLTLHRESELAGMTLDATLALCCVRGWTGFEASWVLKDARSPGGPPPKFNATAHVNRNRGQRT